MLPFCLTIPRETNLFFLPVPCWLRGSDGQQNIGSFVKRQNCKAVTEKKIQSSVANRALTKLSSIALNYTRMYLLETIFFLSGCCMAQRGSLSGRSPFCQRKRRKFCTCCTSVSRNGTCASQGKIQYIN